MCIVHVVLTNDTHCIYNRQLPVVLMPESYKVSTVSQLDGFVYKKGKA